MDTLGRWAQHPRHEASRFTGTPSSPGKPSALVLPTRYEYSKQGSSESLFAPVQSTWVREIFPGAVFETQMNHFADRFNFLCSKNKLKIKEVKREGRTPSYHPTQLRKPVPVSLHLRNILQFSTMFLHQNHSLYPCQNPMMPSR